MKFRAKFCGGCNPRYDRGKAYNTLKERLKEKGIDLELANEDEKATMLLLIGGCSNCCPSYKEFKLKKGEIGRAHV